MPNHARVDGLFAATLQPTSVCVLRQGEVPRAESERVWRNVAGLAKTHLGHVFTATALNLARLDAWRTGTPLGTTRTSHLTKLSLSLTESANGAFKRETLKGRKGWSSEREARLDAFRWLTRYNTRRRHRLGQRSPIAYENAARTTSTTLARTA